MTQTFNHQKNPANHRGKKLSLNQNKDGVVRNINGKVYVDFMYCGERVRETAGLPWNPENAKFVRTQLDKISLAIHEGSFVFRKVFPKSKKLQYFSELEKKVLNHSLRPDELSFKNGAEAWLVQIKSTHRISPRTWLDYKRLLDMYLIPFFGDYPFSKISPATIDDFNIWAKQQLFRQKVVSNKTLNKCLIPLKMICKQTAIRFNWGASYNPFFGYRNLPDDSNRYKIEPFTIDEQQRIVQVLPEHWKPYFQFAFCSGVRQGEQFALRASDVHWSQGVIAITKALTLDEEGRKVEGKTKNRYSRREIPILPAMRSVLFKQQSICERLGSEYLFCTTEGNLLNHANLSNRVWRPALERAGIPYRPMIQTRHSFATTALSLGENPLWIANVMGHRDTDMIIRVYAKYVKNAFSRDGNALNDIYCKTIGRQE